tara:strand:- start:3359 stop:3844 length:486 start_codon:yes stop_codon:yes gene_type:complete
MAGSVNKVILLGNLGIDPDIRAMQNGKKVCNLSVATSDSWKDKETGEKKDKTEWHRVVVFNEGLVGVIEQYVKKGQKLYIEGTLRTRKWTDDSGTEKYTTEVIVSGFGDRIDMIGGKGNNEQIPDDLSNDSENIDKTETAKDDKKNNDSKSESTEEEDIPF